MAGGVQGWAAITTYGAPAQCRPRFANEHPRPDRTKVMRPRTRVRPKSQGYRRTGGGLAASRSYPPRFVTRVPRAPGFRAPFSLASRKTSSLGCGRVAWTAYGPRLPPLPGFDERVAQVIVDCLLGDTERAAHTDGGQLSGVDEAVNGHLG